MHDPEIYFRQLLAGQQVAVQHPVAGQMRNFMYLIGDPKSRKALVVDPAWDVTSLLETAKGDGYEITGALISHYHPDHVGGDLWGVQVEGVSALLEEVSVPLYVTKNEAEGVKVVTGVLDLGSLQIRFLHTPGHTPGSQCFLIGNRLVAGDTLFVQGCGRVDLPGGDPDQMYYSLTQKLAKLPAETVLFPGHDYGPTQTSTIGTELDNNVYLRVRSLEDWQRLMGPY
jgi:glyoxylase-like metal-dependent hydrolase (beta-lactamase superfamily II)